MQRKIMSLAGKIFVVWSLLVLFTPVLSFAEDNAEDNIIKFPRVMSYSNLLWGKNRLKPSFVHLTDLVGKEADKYHINTVLIYPWLDYGKGQWWVEDYGEDIPKALKLAKEKGKKLMFLNILSIPPRFSTSSPSDYKARRCSDYTNPVLLKGARWILEQELRKYPGSALYALGFDEISFKESYSSSALKKFREYLKDKFTSAELAKYGVTNVSTVSSSAVKDRKNNPFLYWAHKDFVQDTFLSFGKKLRESVKKINPEVKLMADISAYALLPDPYSCAFPKLGEAYDVVAIAFFYKGQGEPSISYWYELSSSVAEVVYDTAFYTGYDYPAEKFKPLIKRFSFQNAMHLDGVGLWEFGGIYGTKKQWDPDKIIPYREEALKESFGTIEKAEDYLYKAYTVPTIAIAIEESSAVNGQGVYSFFQKNHIPVACFYLDNLKKEDLPSHKVIIIPAGARVSSWQIPILENWVKEGGTLISAGAVSSQDHFGIKLKDYGMAELFGAGRKDEKIVPTTGKVIVKDTDGSAFVIANSYGKGTSILFKDSSLSPAADPNMKRLFHKILSRGLEKAGAVYPVKVENAPEWVEINLREQKLNEGLNRILHLLNYKDSSVSGITASVYIPEGYSPQRLFSPLTGEEIPFRKEGAYINFTVPSFQMYSVIVAQMNKG